MATHFFWDPDEDNIIQERDDTGTITAEYTTEPYLYGNLISQNRGGVVSQYHFDSQGSTLALTDDNQQVTDTYAYSAFGEVTERTGSTVNPFQYIGQKQYYRGAATGEYKVRSRSLSLATGRWLTPDPIGMIDSSNIYLYVRNASPLLIDPSGKECVGPLKGVTIHRIDIDLATLLTGGKGDWGHWWLEISFAGKTFSFGWWPKTHVPVAEAPKGVPGQLNGMVDSTGAKIGSWDSEHDSHQGDMKGKVFEAKILHDAFKQKRLGHGDGKGKKCADLDPERGGDWADVIGCLAEGAKAFAKQHTIWRYPGSHNCHSFQVWLLDMCCICQPKAFAEAAKNYDKDHAESKEIDESDKTTTGEDPNCACSCDSVTR